MGDHDSKTWLPESIKEISPKAKAICNSCPVQLSCLAFAMRMEAGDTAANRVGIWGGKTPQERYRMYRGEKKRRLIPEHAPEFIECKCGCGYVFDQWRTTAGSPRLKPREFAFRTCQIKYIGRYEPRANRVTQCKAEGCENTFNPFTTFSGTKATSARVYCSETCQALGIPATIRARKQA